MALACLAHPDGPGAGLLMETQAGASARRLCAAAELGDVVGVREQLARGADINR